MIITHPRTILCFALSLIGLYFFKPVFAINSQNSLNDKYIVVLKDQVSSPKPISSNHSKKYGLKINHIYQKTLKGYSAVIPQKQLDKVKNDPDVKYIAADKLFTLDAKPAKPTRPPKFPTATPTPVTPTSTPTPITPTSTPTPLPSQLLSISPTSINVDIMAGTSVKVLELTSNGAAGFSFYGYPTDYGPGINWNEASGGISPGNTTDIHIKVNYGIHPGTYQGTGILKSNPAGPDIQIPITVNVLNNPNGPLITLNYPNGGETFDYGDTVRITWQSQNITSPIYLYYKTCDSCLSPISTEIPSDSTYYDWTINTTSSKAKIEVSGYLVGTGSSTDISDNYFTIIQPTPTPTNTPPPIPQPTQTIPNGIKRIGGPVTNRGGNIGVAVLDTGVNLTHPDLSENIIASYNCLNSNLSADDDNGHGSHVSGTIAAPDNNLGVIGAASQAKIIAIKVLDSSGSGTLSSLLCGLDYIKSNQSAYNIKVANLSLSATGTSDDNCGQSNNDPLHQAICSATQSGITFVVSAGNSSSNTSNHIPAAYNDSVITVSALVDTDGQSFGYGSSTSYGADDTFASFSNYGATIDLGAPGYSVYSTYKNGGYTYMSGTSMSAPHVSAATALYLATNPNATWTQVRDSLINLAETTGNGHTDPSGRHPEPVLKISSL